MSFSNQEHQAQRCFVFRARLPYKQFNDVIVLIIQIFSIFYPKAHLSVFSSSSIFITSLLLSVLGMLRQSCFVLLFSLFLHCQFHTQEAKQNLSFHSLLVGKKCLKIVKRRISVHSQPAWFRMTIRPVNLELNTCRMARWFLRGSRRPILLLRKIFLLGDIQGGCSSRQLVGP